MPHVWEVHRRRILSGIIKMGEYICQKCGKAVDNVARVVCPYCSGRILVKRGAGNVRELPAE